MILSLRIATDLTRVSFEVQKDYAMWERIGGRKLLILLLGTNIIGTNNVCLENILFTAATFFEINFIIMFVVQYFKILLHMQPRQ